MDTAAFCAQKSPMGVVVSKLLVDSLENFLNGEKS